MNAIFYVKLYLLTVPVFFLIDMLWLGVIAKGFYWDDCEFQNGGMPCRVRHLEPIFKF